MILIIFGAVFAYNGVMDMIRGSKTPADYSTLMEADVQKGMIVEGDLYSNMGAFEENYTTRNGVKTGSSKYNYMIPIGETQYMGLLNNTSELQTALDAQADATYAYLLGETTTQPATVHFKGRVMQMDDETRGYMRDYMVSLGMTQSEAESLILGYYIKCENYDSGLMFFIIGIICLGIGIAVIVVPLVAARKKQNVMFANSTPVSTTSYDNDWSAFDNNTFNNRDPFAEPAATMENTVKDPLANDTYDNNMYNNNIYESNNTETTEEEPKSGLSLKLKD